MKEQNVPGRYGAGKSLFKGRVKAVRPDTYDANSFLRNSRFRGGTMSARSAAIEQARQNLKPPFGPSFSKPHAPFDKLRVNVQVDYSRLNNQIVFRYRTADNESALMQHPSIVRSAETAFHVMESIRKRSAAAGRPQQVGAVPPAPTP